MLIGFGITQGGSISGFIDTPSSMITIGGGLLLSLISFSIGDLFGAIGTGFGSSDLGQEVTMRHEPFRPSEARSWE